MYWGDADASLHKIEMANLDGTGRRIIGSENERAAYFAFTFHAGSIYITDWNSPYVYSLAVVFICDKCVSDEINVSTSTEDEVQVQVHVYVPIDIPVLNPQALKLKVKEGHTPEGA